MTRVRWLVLVGLAGIVALVLGAPWLVVALGGAGAVEDWFAEQYSGRLEVEELRLSWFGGCSARGRLVDPSGAVVADGISVETPSLAQLARAGQHELGGVTVTATLELVADEEGVTNLERALAPADTSSDEGSADSDDAGEGPGGDAAPPALDLRVLSPRISWSDARTRRAGRLLVAREVEAQWVTRADGTADVQLQADLEGGDLRARLTGGGGRGDVEVFVDGLPTSLADALLEQGGLLVDVLGPTVQIDLKGSWPAGGEPLRLEVRSERASLSFTGSFEDGALVATQDQRLDAAVPLSPLFSERIVGSLVPVLFHMEKPAGAAPVSVSVSDFRLPLDGDLSKLDALVSLDVGEVAYQLAPGLQDLLGKIDARTQQQLAELPTLEVRIDGGVAHYDQLPLRIWGRDLAFRGSYDLARSEANFAVDVPLRMLGGLVERELDRVSDFLDPDTEVPIELSGSWRHPRIEIADGFVEDALRDAAQRAISRGLRDLLNRDD